MDFNQLESVIAVAKYRNFTRASREVHVSQSSLSQQIMKLEKELGVRLFQRTTRSVMMTPVGEAFVIHAERILNERSEAMRTIAQFKPDMPEGDAE